MAEVKIKTRVQNKIDTSEAWAVNSEFVPLKGEICIESDTRLFKIGDGITNYGNLKYSTKNVEEIDAAIKAASSSVFRSTKTNYEQSDTAVIEAYFAANPTHAAKNSDIFIVKTVVDSVESESAYSYDGTDWVAICGNVDADKVLLYNDITLAGSYTQVGNLTKSSTGTAVFQTKGKSVADVFTEIFSKRLQPTITAQPAVTITIKNGSATMASEYEVGTVLNPTYTASLSAGSYTYGPATGVTATAWSIRDTANNTAETASGSLSAGYTLTTSAYSITATATHNVGAIANDNLGSQSAPVVQIAAGSKSRTSATVTGYRNIFWGMVSNTDDITSAVIRGLSNKKKYAGGNLPVLSPSSSHKRIIVACEATKTGITKVVMPSSSNADCTGSFIRQDDVQVEGANGFQATTYKVWVYEPAVMAGTYQITLG